MAKNRRNSRSDDPNVDSTSYNTVFVDTSLDTHLVLIISSSDTVYDFKEKMLRQHSEIFPRIGGVKIQSVQVKRTAHFYHLPDSMLVSSAFAGYVKTWFLFVEASCSSDHENEQALPGPTPEKDFRVLALPACSGDDDCRDNNKTIEFSHIDELPSMLKKRKRDCAKNDGFTMNKKNKVESKIDPLVEASGEVESDLETRKIRGKLCDDLSSDTNLTLPSSARKTLESESISEQNGELEKDVYRDRSNSTTGDHVPKLEKVPLLQEVKEDKLATGLGSKEESPEANKDKAHVELLPNGDPKVMLSKRCKPLDEGRAYGINNESIPSPDFMLTSSLTEAGGSVKSKKKMKAKKKAPGSTEVGTKIAPPLSSTIRDLSLKDLKNDKIVNDQSMLSLDESQKLDTRKNKIVSCDPDPQVQPSESFKPSDQVEAQEMSKGSTYPNNPSLANDVVETGSSRTIKSKNLKAKKSLANLQDNSDVLNLHESYLPAKGVVADIEMKDGTPERNKAIPQIDKLRDDCELSPGYKQKVLPEGNKILDSAKETPNGKESVITETLLDDKHGMQAGKSGCRRKRNNSKWHTAIDEDIAPMHHSNPVNGSSAKHFEGDKGLSLKNEAEVTSSKASKPLDLGEATVNCSDTGFPDQKLENENGLEAMKLGGSQKKKRARKNANSVRDAPVEQFASEAEENLSTFSGTVETEKSKKRARDSSISCPTTGNESGARERIVLPLPDANQAEETAMDLLDNLKEAKNDEKMDTIALQDQPSSLRVNKVRQLLPGEAEKNIKKKMKKTKRMQKNVAETENNSKIEGINGRVEEPTASGDKMGDRDPPCDRMDRIASAETITGNRSTLEEVLQRKHAGMSTIDANMDISALQDQHIRLQVNEVQQLLPGKGVKEQVDEKNTKKKVKTTTRIHKNMAKTVNNSEIEGKNVSVEELVASGDKIETRDPQCDSMDRSASPETRTGNRSAFEKVLHRKHAGLVSKNDENMDTSALQDQPIRLQIIDVQQLLLLGEADKEQVNEKSIKKKVKKTKRIEKNVAETENNANIEGRNVSIEESAASGDKIENRDPQCDSMDRSASPEIRTGNSSTIAEVLHGKHAGLVSKNDESMDTSALQDQPIRLEVNNVQQLLPGEADKEQVNVKNVKKKVIKTKKIQKNVAEIENNSKIKGKNVSVEESAASGDKLGDREPQCDSMDSSASAETRTGKRSMLAEVLQRKHAAVVSEFPNPEEDLKGANSSEGPCYHSTENNVEGSPEIMTNSKNIAETSKARDGVNFRHYFIPPDQKQNEDSSANKVKEALHSTKAKRKTKKPNSVSDETLEGSRQRLNESNTDGNQLEESSAVAKGSKDIPTTNKKSEAYSDGMKASKSQDVNEEKTPQKSSRNNLSWLEENKGTAMASKTSSNATGSKRTFQSATNGKQQSGFNKGGISALKNSSKNDKDLVNSSQQKKSLLNAAGAIFSDDSSGSSGDENHAHSDASTRTPSDHYSSSSEFSDCESELNQDSRGNGYGGRKNFLTSNKTPDTKEMPLHLILKSSSRFKKAKLTASQAQDADTESQPVEFVPDSQPNQ